MQTRRKADFTFTHPLPINSLTQAMMRLLFQSMDLSASTALQHLRLQDHNEAAHILSVHVDCLRILAESCQRIYAADIVRQQTPQPLF